MGLIEELFFFLFGPGETWAELARGFSLIAVVLGIVFLVQRWMSRDLRKKRSSD